MAELPTMQLPEFDEGSECEKCGCAGVQVQYHAWPSGPHDPGPCGFPRGSRSHKVLYVEHLDRTCTRCGFIWAEAVVPVGEGAAEEGA